jgi:SAM-dependent methyltransferase
MRGIEMDPNLKAYRKNRVVRRYARLVHDGLFPQEKFCLEFVPESNRTSVLDIAIGAGRTVAALSAMFKRYIGVDYSEPMVAAARRLYPGHDLRVMDARQIDFREQFDCIFFSYNGIDYVNFEDRQLILRKVRESLRQGGYFIYSSHNLHYRRAHVWLKFLWVEELFKPFTPWNKAWKKFFLIPYRLINFWRQSVDEVNGIAYINDVAESFSYISTYVDIERELENLKKNGFSVLSAIGFAKPEPGYDANDHCVYIVARKD